MVKEMQKIRNVRGVVEDTRLEAKAKNTKKTKAKDNPSEDRPSRGQGQKCSRTRTKNTGESVLQKNNKKGDQNFFSGELQKNLKKKSSKIFFRRSPKKTSKTFLRRS